jgi:hypothetical protein
MKTAGVLTVVGTLFILLAAGFARPTANPQQKQLTALQTQLRALKSQVKKLEARTTSVETEMLANYQGDACTAAVTADGVQGTWTIIDDLAKKTGNATYFGTQTSVRDLNACLVGITRKPGANPPTLDPFQSAITWLVG